MSGSITLAKVGRRFYLVGNTFQINDKIKAANGHFDGERKQWWVSKEAVAQQLVGQWVESQTAEKKDGIGLDDRVVRGRAEYEGKQYYFLTIGRNDRGAYAKLVFRDGSRVFWAKSPEQVRVVKEYRDPTSINALRRFAEQAKAAEAKGECPCSCHSHHACVCRTTGTCCPIHFDGCDRCGCENDG